MIAVGREIEVRKLLASGSTVTEIYRLTGVSRLTIRTIRKYPNLRERYLNPINARRLRTPRKCHKCGGMVNFWPCIACWPQRVDFRDATRQDDDAEYMEVEHLMPEIKRIIVDLRRYYEDNKIADGHLAAIGKRASEIYDRLPNGDSG